MIKTTTDGYKILIRSDGLEEFMIDSDRIQESIGYIRQNDLRHIGINSFLGYKKSDIGFLSEVADFVEGVTITEPRDDISIVNGLHKLKSLGFVDNKESIIDLSNFPDLSTLACSYSERLISLESCEQLKDLTLTGYKPPDQTLEMVPALSSLTSFKLFVTNITSLAGVEKFPILKELSLYKAAKLEDLSDIEKVKPTLCTLEIDSCKRINDYSVLGRLLNLERLIITNSAGIKSLGFVRSLSKLKSISFVGTNVEDGNLGHVVDIAYVGFENRTHYSHTFEQLSGKR